jgi:hypothetical protein
MMSQPPGTFRPIRDTQAEMEQLAAGRMHPPAKVVAPGDILRVYAPGGETVLGRVSGVTLSPGGRFMVVCEPLGGR